MSILSQHSFTNHPHDSTGQLQNAWIGRSIGDSSRYRLDQRLGSGGMGEVYLATDTRLGKPVALKLLKQSLAIAEDTDLRERFERECSICAALKSPHIVQVTDYGVTAEGYPFYIMEYLQGQTLGELLATQPRLSVERTCNIMTQVCDGLRLAHSGVVLWSAETGESERIKVVHRDLKPANLILVSSALGELVKIIDFGIAQIRSLENELTSATTLFMGTCHYASPEQFNLSAKVDERADIYSLGMILYEMLAGTDPFGLDFRTRRVTNDAWLTAHARKSPISLQMQPDCQDISSSLESIVMRCLEKRPDDRFASVAELSEALQAVSAGASVDFWLSSTAISSSTAIKETQRQNTGFADAPRLNARSIPTPAWLLLGGAMLALSVAITLPQLLRSGNSLTPNQSIDSTSFSLNTHQLSPVKTLSENPAQSRPIWAAVLSPDRRTLISGGEDRDLFDDRFFPVKIWNFNTPEAPNTLNGGHTASIYSLSQSQDGQTLASGSADNTIKIWDVPTGKLLRTLQGHKAPVWSVVLSRDGKTLISGSADNTIKIWDVSTGTVLHTLTEHTNIVYSVALSPDQQTIVSGSQDFTIKLWNAKTGELIRTLSQPEGHLNTVRAVAISPDGQQIASASWEKNIKLWNLQTGRLLRTLNGHSDKVVAIAFLNNQTLASGSLDHSLRIWDTQTEKFQEIQEAHADWVLSVAAGTEQTFGAEQTLLSTSQDKTIKVWQWTTLSSN